MTQLELCHLHHNKVEGRDPSRGERVVIPNHHGLAVSAVLPLTHKAESPRSWP